MAKATTVFDTIAVDIVRSSEAVFLISFVLYLNQGNGMCLRKKKLGTMWVLGW